MVYNGVMVPYTSLVGTIIMTQSKQEEEPKQTLSMKIQQQGKAAMSKMFHEFKKLQNFNNVIPFFTDHM